MGASFHTTAVLVEGPSPNGSVNEAGLDTGSVDPLLALEAGTEAVTSEAPPVETRRGASAARDPLGRVVFALVHATVPARFEELQTPRVAPLVQRLRCRVGLALGATVATLPIAFWQLIVGAITYISTEKPACGGPMRIWLLGFLILQLVWPTCMPSATMLLLGWCLGALLLLRDPPGCPNLHDFVVQALLLQCLQTLLLFLATYAAVMVQPLLQQLKDLLSERGTAQDIIDLIKIVPASQMPSEEECVICMDCEEEGVPWLELKCAHRFHETCLLQWLKKARRCPMCRIDLHEAYAQDLAVVDPGPPGVSGRSSFGAISDGHLTDDPEAALLAAA